MLQSGAGARRKEWDSRGHRIWGTWEASTSRQSYLTLVELGKLGNPIAS